MDFGKLSFLPGFFGRTGLWISEQPAHIFLRKTKAGKKNKSDWGDGDAGEINDRLFGREDLGIGLDFVFNDF